MNSIKLIHLAEQLLDLSKTNPLLNFKSAQSGNVEVLYPSIDTVFKKLKNSYPLEVYDAKALDKEKDQFTSFNKREVFLNKYKEEVEKNGKILLYDQKNTTTALRNVNKKTK